MKVLILTGQRKGEVSRLKSEMVGEDTITLPSWGTKNGHEHTFPIGVLTKAMVQGKTGLVFPARGKDTPFNGFSKCKAKLDRDSGVKDWVLHDLRRTFASGLASIGVQLPVVERLLNHVSGSFSGIVAVYQRYDSFRKCRMRLRDGKRTFKNSYRIKGKSSEPLRLANPITILPAPARTRA